MQFLSSLSILLCCLCLKQLGPNVLPLFSTSTPECTSLGCQAALSSMSTGNGRERERERERVVTAPREVPACSLELTSPQPRMVLGCAHSPGGTAAPSEPLLCYVRTCTESVPRRAGGSHLPSAFWSQVFHRSVCRDTEGPGRVGCLHLGVVSFLLLWMSPEVLGLGPLPAGSVRDLVAPFNSLDLRCCPQGTATTVKSCIWTWVAGWDLAWVSPRLPSCLCPAPLRALRALVIKVGHLNLIYCLFPQFASEVWGYFVHDVCLEP